MEFDIEALDTGQAYKLLASVVVPRPIALVSTLDAGGMVNAAPYSFFNLIGSAPPTVVLGVGNKKPERRRIPAQTLSAPASSWSIWCITAWPTP